MARTGSGVASALGRRSTAEEILGTRLPLWIQLAAGVVLGAIGFALGRHEWLIRAEPSPSRVLGLSLDASKAIFFAACLGVIAVARYLPRARDFAHLVVGLAWFLAAAGLEYTLGMGAIAVLLYYFAARVHPHLAMAIVAVLLLVFARYWFSQHAAGPGVRLGASLAALRMIYYAFELRSIRRDKRSLVSMLAYAPFSLLLWPGPIQLSYLTYNTNRPQQDLDRLGAQQFARGGAKLLACALVLFAMRQYLPDISSFRTSSFGARAAFVLLPYPIYFLEVSIRQDIAAAFCNFSGHYAPNAFRWPFLAKDPFELWRRWNVHVVDFLRRAFIYEAARRRRSIAVMIFAGMIGSLLYHGFKMAFISGPGLKLGDLGYLTAGYLGVVAVLLLLAIPLEKYGDRLPKPASFSIAVLSQLGFALMAFVYLSAYIVYEERLPASPGCLFIGMFVRSYAGSCT